MDDITKIISSALTLKRLNACRIYLQVTWVSDISNMKGDKILESALKGERSINQTSNVQCPLQQRPNEQIWKIWRKIYDISITAATIIYFIDNINYNDGYLAQDPEQRNINTNTHHY